jgi:hypothetical protein
VPQGVNKIGRLKGTPFLSRIAKYHPVQFADQLRVPILIIIAAKEELMDNRLHGERVYKVLEVAIETGWYDLAMVGIMPAGWYDWSKKSLAHNTLKLVQLQGLLKRAREAGIGLIGMKAVN